MEVKTQTVDYTHSLDAQVDQLYRVKDTVMYGYIGHDGHDNISFQQFNTLFRAMWVANKSNKMHFVGRTLSVVATYTDQRYGTYFTNGSNPIFYQESNVSDVSFWRESGEFSAFKCVTQSKCSVKVEEVPLAVLVRETWTFVHKLKTKYVFIKQVQGQNKQDACDKDPQFLVQVYVDKDFVPESKYANTLIQKTFDVFGFGPVPTFVNIIHQKLH